MSYKNKEKGKRFFNSVTFQSWASFLALSFLIITIMMVSFLTIYGLTYSRERQNDAQKTAQLIIASLPSHAMTDVENEAYHDLLEENCRPLSMSVVVFKCEDLETATVDNCEVVMFFGHVDDSGKGGLVVGDENYIVKLKETQGKYFCYSTVTKNGSLLTMGASKLVDGKPVYFYMTAFVENVDRSIRFMTRLNLSIALIVFAVSIVFVFFITRHVSGPLVNFTKEIKKARNDENYVFQVEGNGYSEIDELAQTLNDSVNASKKTEELRRDIIANVSHDLRTPLTMIKAYAEMIRDLSGDNPQKRDEHCEIIINEVDVLNTLVGDLLDLSKIQAGTVEIIKSRESITKLVLSVLERLDIFRIRDGYDFIVDIQDDCYAECDYARTEQAVYNLICNAINYTGDDKKIFVSLKNNNGTIRFEVRDTGKGIKKDEIENIWNKYYRSKRTKRGVAGSGIGLSIVQNVFEKQSIKYGVESEENNGSTFWFEIEQSEKKE